MWMCWYESFYDSPQELNDYVIVLKRRACIASNPTSKKHTAFPSGFSDYPGTDKHPTPKRVALTTHDSALQKPPTIPADCKVQ